MDSNTTVAGDRHGSVQIRQYVPADRPDVLALDEVVWDRSMDESWFAWKYEENPYTPEPPVFVARANGQVVGARPFMAFRLCIGDAFVDALQPSDTMVHPEYRGQGIFTRMTETALTHYADREPQLCFNFPNEMAWPGYQGLGWRKVNEQTTYYRIQSPGSLSSLTLENGVARGVSRAAGHAAQTFLTVWSQPVEIPDGYTVEREEGVPVEKLVALYQRQTPNEIHAYRDREYYEWRFDSPAWRRHTLFAYQNGERVVGTIVRTRTTADDTTITQMADVVPLTGGDRWADALTGLLGQIVTAHSSSDILVAHDTPFSNGDLTSHGFLPDTRLPLSLCTDHERTFAVRPLGDLSAADWHVNSYDLTDHSNWLIPFSERDTA